MRFSFRLKIRIIQLNKVYSRKKKLKSGDQSVIIKKLALREK